MAIDYFVDSVKSLAATLRNLFRTPTTVQFPKVIRPRAERLRASFALLHEENGDEACIGCLQCEKICPSQVISIKGPAKRESPITGKKRGYADDFTLDLSACIFCELCVQVCPTDAIIMMKSFDMSTADRRELLLDKDRLHQIGLQFEPSWATGNLLRDMQTPPKAPKAGGPAE